MVRGLVRLSIVLALVAAVVGTTKNARACGRGSYGLEGLAYVAAAGAVLAGTVVVTDTVFTVYDAAHAPVTNAPSVGWATTERWMSTTQVVIGGLLSVGMFSSSQSEDLALVPTVVAWTAWPAALMAHGFYAHEANPYGADWQAPVIVIGSIDGLLAAYDVGMAVTGHHVSDWYAIGEIFGATPQVIFGLSYAGATGGQDGRTALLFTALPAAMMVHGIIELAVPEKEEEPPPMPSQGPATGLAAPRPSIVSSIVPSFMVQGVRGPAPGLGIAARF